MKKLILDTSFLSAYLNNVDVNHEKALGIYDKICEDRGQDVELVVSVNVLVELLVGVRKLKKRKLNKILEFIEVFTDQVIDIRYKNIEEFVEYLRLAKSSITPVDQYLLFLAKKYDAEILTFDKKLLRKSLAEK
ncbi:PIN domain-containing protein [Candidatus Dojkabacteria bacterium]|nr:PIN domain-containing protein [Candidatus Dojkabacteria bacterium]